MHALGMTRGASRREYLLHTPDTFVRTPLPGLVGGWAVVHAAPQMGAAFAMTTVEMSAGATLQAGPTQRFVYVLEGEVALTTADATQPAGLAVGGFVFLPAPHGHRVEARTQARLLVLEKPLSPLAPENGSALPHLVQGHERDVPALPLNGDDGVQVRALLPASPAFDFAVNTMTYQPGASLSQVEVHYMEHGLLMLGGGGIYRLGDDWHSVGAGDAIWMAPFCPQWFAAVGKTPAKYLIYKDCNRHVLA